ncbi:putative signal transducing protein [Flavobacterium suncheonense]
MEKITFVSLTKAFQMNDFVTVAVFDYPHEITVLKHLLDQAEIDYFFENETMMNIAPMYSQALGGIRLKVHPEDAETVREILKKLNDESNLKIV